MSKTVRDTHITGENGVLTFAKYCNQHKPYIFFREVLKNDFGIDAEIELTRTNEDKKIEPTGEIIKVQIKSVNSDKSYIKNERESQFEFIPRKDDIDYWEKYTKNGIEVILVIYDQRKDALYCKKVFDHDIFIANRLVTKGKKRNINPITFNKKDNILEFGVHDFATKYSTLFKSKVNFDTNETLLTNFLKLKEIPKQLIKYSSLYKNKKAVFELIENHEAPYFVLKDNFVYTFSELGVEYNTFKAKILAPDTKESITLNEVLSDTVLRNYYAELLNEHLRDFLRRKNLLFNRQHKRFYFRLPKEHNSLNVEVTTRKRGQVSSKVVIKKYEYANGIFFRHLAVEFKFRYIANEIYLIINPKYYFTSDGWNLLEPDKITKLTNFLTSREFNNHYCDSLHFWWTYLSGGKDDLVIYMHPSYNNITTVQSKNFYNKNPKIIASYFKSFTAAFGISNDVKPRSKKQDSNDTIQPELFQNEN